MKTPDLKQGTTGILLSLPTTRKSSVLETLRDGGIESMGVSEDRKCVV